jgi:hypothetical protein
LNRDMKPSEISDGIPNHHIAERKTFQEDESEDEQKEMNNADVHHLSYSVQF